MPSEWACTVAPGRQVRISELPWSVAASIGPEWGEVFVRPLTAPEAAQVVYEACCKLAGVEPKELTIGEMVSIWNLIEDDRPTMFDGGMPVPKAESGSTPTA
jgi:hypothetical protein